MKIETAKINGLDEESGLMSTHFIGNYRNCGKIDHEVYQDKSNQLRKERNEIIYNYCINPGFMEAYC
jgi:hypothetical protein